MLTRCCHTFLLLFGLLGLTITGYTQSKNNIQFTHLTTINGLSQSRVNCIIKDRLGFMWFGTQNGLNKYDGYKFKIYQNSLKDSTSIPNNNINSLFEDSQGNLWVGTNGGGLALYNRDKDDFISYGLSGTKDEILSDRAITAIYEDRQKNFWVGTFSKLNLLNRATKKVKQYAAGAKGLSNNIISSVYEDRRGNLWIGTVNGLNLLNRKTGKFSYFFHDATNAGSISNNRVSCINEDAEGNLWVGTGDGLNLFDHEKKTFYAYKNEAGNYSSISNNVINAICTGGKNQLWVGTENALELFDTDKTTFTHYQEIPHDERSLSYSSIYSLLVDDQGILWAGTFGGGVNKYDKNQTSFNLYRNLNNENLNTNTVSSFAEEKDGDVWVGTDGGGLYLWQRTPNWFIAFNPQSKQHYFASLSILALKLSADKKTLWVGTYDRGVIKLDLTTMRSTFYAADMLKNNAVYALMEDHAGNLWIGTNGGGVSVLNPATGKIKNYSFTKYGESISSNFIRSIYEDNDRNIWIGTYSGGLNLLDQATGKFTYYNTLNSKLQSDIIYAIYEDSKNNLWIGTMSGGLHLFDKRANNFIPFTKTQGLASNIVNNITEDKNGHLWISTDNGVSRFYPAEKKFKTYTVLNGLQGNEFVLGAGILLSTNEILFGGLNGFNLINPDNIKENRQIPRVVITDFMLFNKSIPIANKNSPLKLNINETHEIVLSHNQSVFTIEFAALSYTIPEKNKYAYKLEGFDKRWNYVQNERKATYTNLDPGEYTFRVIASNNDGVWNKEGTFVKIIITPPFWKTKLAYFIYLLVIAGILYVIYKEIVSREKLKNEVIYQKITASKMQELNQLKISFFTNISHELRTPLSLIIDPLRKITNEDMSTDKTKTYSALAYKNASRLMALVNQLLDFRKLETGNLELEAKKTSVVTVISDIFENFQIRAKERGIDYSLNIQQNITYAWIDSDKLNKILTNLIANAFKHTPDNGKIQVLVKQVTLEPAKDFIEIHVIDTGIGIPLDLQEKIFDIFYQVKGTQRFAKESSGIGLALTKELVSLHNGEIFVESKEGQGADFIFRIPVGDEHFKPDTVEESAISVNGAEPLAYTGMGIKKSTGKNANTDAPIILIVEDNPDLRRYILEELSGTYQVEEASDGIEGLEKALSIVPDLVISDILMSGSDGLELCGKLKTNEKTSHIPVILLTAKQTEDNKIEGYTTGADAYIAKPYNSELLKVRIKNILDSRKKLRVLYAKHTDGKNMEPGMSAIDKQFLKKTVKIIDENIADLNFDIDKLAGILSMSRRQLYRKLSALTNKTVHDFIMGIRLERASNFLLSGNFTISEVAYKVGFSEPANFSRSFSKEFGMSPKSYLSQKSKV